MWKSGLRAKDDGWMWCCRDEGWKSSLESEIEAYKVWNFEFLRAFLDWGVESAAIMEDGIKFVKEKDNYNRNLFVFVETTIIAPINKESWDGSDLTRSHNKGSWDGKASIKNNITWYFLQINITKIQTSLEVENEFEDTIEIKHYWHNDMVNWSVVNLYW